MKTWCKRFWAVVQLAAAVSGGSVCANILLASPTPASPPADTPSAKVARPLPGCHNVR